MTQVRSRVPAGDELAAGRGADGLDVVTLQLHSISSQLVQSRGLDGGVVVADVIESLIVCHDENDMRRLRRGGAVSESLDRLDLHLVRTHPVPRQVPEAEQTHHRETGQSRRGHSLVSVTLLKRRSASHCAVGSGGEKTTKKQKTKQTALRRE